MALSHHTPGKQSFTLLHDKNMLAPASASSWCPTMDLLALATTDGQLSLSRLEWNKQGGERENKLWSTNPDAPVTSLGWRPDGKVLVSGHADGTVVLHHVEDGETLHVSKPHARAVTSLHWQIAPASDAARSAFAHQSAAAGSRSRRGGAAEKGGAAAAAAGAPRRAERTPFARRWWITSTRRTDSPCWSAATRAGPSRWPRSGSYPWGART